jgi:hypothetical protein
MDVMADDSFKILVDYGQLNEVMFVPMTCHEIVYCATVVLHTFLQKYTFLWNFVNNGEKQTTVTGIYNSFFKNTVHFAYKMKKTASSVYDCTV